MPGYLFCSRPNFAFYSIMKLRCIASLAGIMTITTLISCSKDNSPAGSTDYSNAFKGDWQFVMGASDQKYLLFFDNRTFSQLSSETAINFHSRNDGVALVTKDQLVLSFTSAVLGTSVYNYSISHDTLSLSALTDIYKLVRTSDAPDTSAWIKTVQSTFSFHTPVNSPVDISYDGANLWSGNGGTTPYIYKISPNTGAKDSILVNKTVQAIEFDGFNLWVNDDGTTIISNVNITTGVEISHSSVIGPWVYAIARDGNFLWCYSNTDRKLYKYDITTNTVVTSIAINTSIKGMTFNNGYLFMGANGALHKCSFNPFRTEKSYTLPGYTITGVAFDGSSFWVSANRTVNRVNSYEILKLTGVD